METETIKGPSRAELSRALRLAYEQLFQLQQIFHHLVADEANARAERQLEKMKKDQQMD